MWLDETSTYKYGNNESVRRADENLQNELNELKREIETNELVHGVSFARPFSSVPVPKDPLVYARERKLHIEKLLRVHDTRNIYIQADVIQEQIESTSKNEYTLDSLPLILHQFFIDKIGWSIYAKHAHELRWKRFGEHVNVIEDMYIHYKNRMSDSVHRAQRLSVAREALLQTNSSASAINAVQPDDVLIYLRWLIAHFYSQKSFQQSMKIIEWLPYQMSVESISASQSLNSASIISAPATNSNLDQTVQQLSNFESFYRSANEASTNNYASNSLQSILVNKFKLLDNICLPNANALTPRDEYLNTISFLFNQDEMPMHRSDHEFLMPRLRFLLNLYKIDYNLSRMQTSGDEMELFAAVNRKFRQIFAEQESMKTFRIYDVVVEGDTENWGADSPLHALKKESNWLEFIQLTPHKDHVYEKTIAKIKLRNAIDQYILPHANFLEINNDERVQEALRENSTIMKTPPSVEPLSVTTHTTSFNTNALWKKIFHNPNLNNKDDQMITIENYGSSTSAAQTRPVSFRSKTSSKKQDEFNFIENLQKLGLDDSKSSEQNLTNVQGSYISFLLLRHLRIRDLKRQALSYLNYFRSIERTVTIYYTGLSVESRNFKRQSAQSNTKETPYAGNLGCHAYMYNTPKDFKVCEAEFMEFAEIENHDDYYTIDEKDFVHVQDQRGFYIIYESAVADLKKLENELLLIASYYIAKDKECGSTQRHSETRRKRHTSETTLNLNTYSHQNVDRFGILLDIWTSEVNLLQMKKRVMDIYYEVYQNVFDKVERQNLSQIITDLIYKRVRFDLDANYFTQAYRLEVSCLFKHSCIIKLILDKMIDQMRSFIEKNDSDTKYGLPYSVVKKNLICLTPNQNNNTLKNLYLLEFHPCLAAATRIPSALKQGIEELIYFKSITNVSERVNLEQTFLNRLLETLQTIEPPGQSFNAQIQKEVFNGSFVEDPVSMNELAEWQIRQAEEAAKNKTKKEQSDLILASLTRILEMVTWRHRLLNAALETEVLTKLYKKQANDMGFEDYHMYLRYAQFDFAKFKENAANPPPVFVNEHNNEETQVDRYVPNCLGLAMQELEEGQMSKFNFKGRESVLQVLRPGGTEDLQLSVKLQVGHNSALVVSVMQAHACSLTVNLAPRKKGSVTADASSSKKKDSDKKDDLKMLDFKNTNSIPAAKIISTGSASVVGAGAGLRQFSEAFVSLQIEKSPYRQLMLNEYIRQKEVKGLILSNPNEMMKLKRTLLNDYAAKFSKRVTHYSLRGQLIMLYYSITKILESFPNTRDNHFVFGEAYEKRPQAKTNENNETTTTTSNNNDKEQEITDESMDYIKADARIFKKRPRKILSDDGERVLNIWFIPHYTELLTMYKKRSNEFCSAALKHCVRIVGAFNDILHFLYASACINIAVTSSMSSDSSTAQVRRQVDFTSWENAGGLDTDLNEIQQEMNQLSDPCDPEQVAEYLELKRAAMFLQYDCAIRHAVKDIFLANGSAESYKQIHENMNFSLKFLNDYMYETSENVYLGLPEPLDARDIIASHLLPWRTFIAKNGSFPLHYWPWYLIEPNVTLCITGLKDMDKNVANGEILGVTLLMEDLLTSPANANDDELLTSMSEASFGTDSNMSLVNNKENGKQVGSANEHGNYVTDQSTKSLILNASTKKSQLIRNYNKWRFFLITWKRLELLKLDWAKRKLGIDVINNSDTFLRFCESYRKEVLLPILKILVKSTELKDFYDNLVDFRQPVLLPPDVSELESKIKQITRLLEKMELSMIDETTQRVQKETKLVLAERGREENTLTTDLWKKAIMKEEFTINRPHITNDFSRRLWNCLQPVGAGSEYRVSEKDLKECLVALGGFVQERERSNFEQYTMFYENLLRQQHQLLYSREREIKSLKDVIENKAAEVNVEVQCQMADSCYDLIMEVTALRAKLNETVFTKEKLEKELREKVKAEFIDLVTDLVNVNTSLKSQIDQFKETVHENALEIIAESRVNAVDQVLKLKEKFGIEIAKAARETQLNQQRLIAQLQKENHELKILLIKQKNFDKLKLQRDTTVFNKKLSEITKMSDKIKRNAVDNQLINEQKLILVNQQKQAFKRQLAKMDAEFSHLRVKFEKELKEKQNREHELHQKMKNDRNLNSAKQSNVEKLFEELEAKDIELRNLHIITDKTSKLHSFNETKIQHKITNLKKSLMQERNLKLDAFQKVDELQSHLYDLEDEFSNVMEANRPMTSIERSSKTLRNASSLGLNGFKNLVGIQRANSGNNNSNLASNDAVKSTSQNSLLNSRPKTSNAKFKEIEDTQACQKTLYHETISKLSETRFKTIKS